MLENIIELKEKFQRIKRLGAVKSLRNGPTGVGYTFEKLIGKTEDQNITPDYKNIEIKCKFGYSKWDLGLFTSTPKSSNSIATHYIFQKYSYHLYGNENLYRLFSRKIFANSNIELHSYSFRLNVDYNQKKLIVKSYKNGVYCEDVCYWEFNELESRLKIKLENLALVKAYPYRTNGDIYYKYFSINFYKLKSFNTFLKLIEEDKIYVTIYLRESVNKLGDYIIKNNGFSFKIKNDYIENLFYKLDI